MVDLVSGEVHLLLLTGTNSGLSVTETMLHTVQVDPLVRTVREVAMVARVLL